MSWSLHYVGTPAAVAHALETHAERNHVTGQSLVEYTDAKDALVALVRQNVFTHPGAMVSLAANGHASFDGGVLEGRKTYGTCNVTLGSVGGQLVTDTGEASALEPGGSQGA